jgi:hypothetical protein
VSQVNPSFVLVRLCASGWDYPECHGVRLPIDDQPGGQIVERLWSGLGLPMRLHAGQRIGKGEDRAREN